MNSILCGMCPYICTARGLPLTRFFLLNARTTFPKYICRIRVEIGNRFLRFTLVLHKVRKFENTVKVNVHACSQVGDLSNPNHPNCYNNNYIFESLVSQLTISAFKNVRTRSDASNAFKEC